MVSIIELKKYHELCSSLGVDADYILRKFGIVDVDLSDEYKKIPYETFARLVEYASFICHDDLFGIKLSKMNGCNFIAPLDIIFNTSLTLSEAIYYLSKYVHMHARGLEISLSVDSGIAKLNIRNVNFEIDKYNNLSQYLCQQLYNYVSLFEVFGDSLFGVNLKQKKPRLNRSLTTENIQFSSGFNGVRFPGDWLGNRRDYSENNNNASIVRVLYHWETKIEENFISSVKSEIRRNISKNVSIGEISRRFSMTEKAFNQAIRREGFIYKELVEQCLITYSKEMLLDGSVRVCELAKTLGYESDSSFTRAFKRWVGISPKKWQTNNKVKD